MTFLRKFGALRGVEGKARRDPDRQTRGYALASGRRIIIREVISIE
jgi:hypothetical protein